MIWRRGIWGLIFGMMLALLCEEANSQDEYRIERLPHTINSAYEEIKPFTSVTGDSLFFVRAYSPDNTGGENAGEDIWMSVSTESAGWREASNSFGYQNHVGPDFFVGFSEKPNTILTVHYQPAGQDRLVSIRQYDLAAREFFESDVGTIFPLKMEDDYHDLYLHPGGSVLLLSVKAINSIGQEDLYISIRGDDGAWTYPANLGPVINTRGFEISPFLSDDCKTLYFASNGHDGLGDSDIYYSRRLDEGWLNWSQPVNMGAPINSAAFDAYPFINGKDEMFLASNRDGKYADIYKVTRVRYHDYSTTLMTAETGTHDSGGSKADTLATESSTAAFQLVLHFEFDDFSLREGELRRLKAFAAVIMDSTNAHFEIHGYTDDTGTPEYNIGLSEKRAEHVFRHLKKMGIDKDRLTAKGMGVYPGDDGNDIPSVEMRTVRIIQRRNLK